jgi:hypothetical protein
LRVSRSSKGWCTVLLRIPRVDSDRARQLNWLVDSNTDTAVKAGWLVKDGGHWSLTSEGYRAYGEYYNDPKELARQANRKSSRVKRLGSAKGLVTLVGGLTTLLAALFGLYRFGVWVYDQTPQGQMATEQKRLNELRADVGFKVFTNALGMEPQRCNPMPSPPGRPPRPWKQCTFTRPFEYVKVVLDKDDANARVLQYAVTVRHPKFRPTFEYRGFKNQGGDSYVKVTLGESTVAEVSGELNTYFWSAQPAGSATMRHGVDLTQRTTATMQLG